MSTKQMENLVGPDKIVQIAIHRILALYCHSQKLKRAGSSQAGMYKSDH